MYKTISFITQQVFITTQQNYELSAALAWQLLFSLLVNRKKQL